MNFHDEYKMHKLRQAQGQAFKMHDPKTKFYGLDALSDFLEYCWKEECKEDIFEPITGPKVAQHEPKLVFSPGDLFREFFSQPGADKVTEAEKNTLANQHSDAHSLAEALLRMGRDVTNSKKLQNMARRLNFEGCPCGSPDCAINRLMRG